MTIFDSLLQISKFVGDAAGLEKTLRLLQSTSQIFAAYALTASAAAPWLQARQQLALGRRYLRILKFTDAFALAFGCVSGERGVVEYLEFGKWSCLGMYLGLESITMLDTMGIYPTTWAAPLFREAMKFWFFSLLLSILVSLLQLRSLQSSPVLEKPGERQLKRKGLTQNERSTRRRALLKKLATDMADIFIPGTITGWMPTSFAGVGWVGVVSTVLSGSDVWVRIQRT